MNNADKIYNELLEDILKNGHIHHNRTGIDTLSVFGRQLRFNLQEGFPLLTGKKVWFKGILHEMLWFLGAVPNEYKKLAQTNIKYLVDNNVNIWNEWPYKYYIENRPSQTYSPYYSLDDFVQRIKDDWNFAKKWGNLGPVYGEQWVNWKGFKQGWNSLANSEYSGDFDDSGINQIQNVIDTLKNNPDSRRILVSAWNPSDLPDMLLPPCHYSFQFKSEVMNNAERNSLFLKYALKNQLDITGMSTEQAMNHYNFPKRKLHLLWNQRSVDTFLGLIFNIASYALLLKMMAQITDHIASDLIFSGGDVHIYSNHMNQVKEQLNRELRKLPELELNKNIKDIFKFRYNDFNIIGYNPHPAIKAKVAV